MAISKQGFQDYINTYLADNNVGAIDAVHVRTSFQYIIDTLLWAEQRRDERKPVIATGSTMVFVDINNVITPFAAGTNVTVPGIRCYDAAGQNIDFQITAVDESSIAILPASDGYVDYVAIAKNVL